MPRMLPVNLLLAVSLAAQDAPIREFTIRVPQETLADLQIRLSRTRFPNQIPGSARADGADTACMRELVACRRTSCDWRKHEAELNRLPHFKTEIDGPPMRFIHVRSKQPDALPLIVRPRPARLGVRVHRRRRAADRPRRAVRQRPPDPQPLTPDPCRAKRGPAFPASPPSAATASTALPASWPN